MLYFFLFLNFMLNIIILCLCVSSLRTLDDNVDLLLEIERNQRKFNKKGNK